MPGRIYWRHSTENWGNLNIFHEIMKSRFGDKRQTDERWKLRSNFEELIIINVRKIDIKSLPVFQNFAENLCSGDKMKTRIFRERMHSVIMEFDTLEKNYIGYSGNEIILKFHMQ